VLDEWIDQWSTEARQAAAPAGRSGKKSAGKKPAAKKAAAKKAAPSKAAAKKKPAKKAASPDAIGANPSRRYGSAGSRSLSR
jgi:polyhydroxyalkanoate synthase